MDVEDKPDVHIHPPTVFFASLIIGFTVRVFSGGWLPLPEVFAEGAGGLLMIGAMIMVVMAISAFSESGEELRPTTPSNQLFTGGPFKFSRNPIYLAMVLFGIGFGIATLNVWIILTSILTGIIFNFFVIPQEEQYLGRRFGSEYDDYQSRVRRWL